MKLNIPFYRQDTGYTCGPTALQMAFSFLGKFKSEKNIAREAGTQSKTGTSHHGMIEAALREKFYCYVNEGSTLDELKYFIKLGHPVIVNYIEPSSDEGHYAVVTGYNNKHITLNDPWNGKDFNISEQSFLARWHDMHEGRHPCTSWIMVLGTEPFSLGKQYAPDLEK